MCIAGFSAEMETISCFLATALRHHSSSPFQPKKTGMEKEPERDESHGPAKATWPWLPETTNVPAPLLLQPLDEISDWMSSEELCDICSTLTLDGLRPRNSFQHRTAKDLNSIAGATVRAGGGGCPLCALIWRRMRDHFVYYFPNPPHRFQVDSKAMEDHTHTYARWADWEAWRDRGQEVDAQAREERFAQLMSQNEDTIMLIRWAKQQIEIIHDATLYWPYNEPPEIVAIYRIARERALSLYALPDAPSTGQVKHHIPWRNLTQAAQYTASWAQLCLKTHASCPKQIKSILPKRLVDVGRHDTSDMPRLWNNPTVLPGAERDPSPPPITGTYLALSYCWGETSFPVAHPGILDKWRAELPVNDLPKTIQDAIEFTKLLGVRYLWVDSLCILQGNSEEAKDDWKDESVKMQSIYQNAFLTIGAAAGKDAYHGISVNADRPEMPFFPLPKDFGGPSMPGRIYVGLQETAIRQDPLHRRGWTFQEFLLSTRYVNLGNPSIFWSCKQLHRYERLGNHLMPNDSVEHYPKIPSYIAEVFRPDFLGTEWQSVVRNYTDRFLSRPEDRLIALSGVAKDFWHRTEQQDEYLAGLWRSSIISDLVWKVKKSTGDLPSHTLPSWSWASRNKSVSFSLGKHRPECSPECAQLLDCQVVGEPDQFGYSVKGSIKLSGWIKRMSFRVESQHSDDGLYEIEDSLADVARGWLDYPIKENCFEVLCLLVHEGWSGLLLSPVCEDSSIYKRIGCFNWRERRGFGGVRREIKLI